MGFWNHSPPEHESTQTSPPAPEKVQPTSPPRSVKQSRDEEANAELAALLSSLDREHSAASQNSKTSTARKEDEDYESAFPGEMNCMTAFDEMYYCYSLGGQFLNVYRYGGVRDCSEKSKDWRFCMRTKTYGPVARKAMIMARNKEKAMKWKTGPSSEDIWTVRTEPVQRPFSGQVEDLVRDSLS